MESVGELATQWGWGVAIAWLLWPHLKNGAGQFVRRYWTKEDQAQARQIEKENQAQATVTQLYERLLTEAKEERQASREVIERNTQAQNGVAYALEQIKGALGELPDLTAAVRTVTDKMARVEASQATVTAWLGTINQRVTRLENGDGGE